MKTGAKTGAILILTLCILLFIGSIAGTVYLYGTGAVNQRGMKYYETDIFQYQLSDSAWQYINYYYYNSDAGKKELEEREKEAETSGEDVSSDDGLAFDNIVTGSISEGSRVYTVDRWQQIVGDTVAVIPGWDDMREGSYEIKVGGYSYTVETTADGKKRFINEDGSIAFLLYRSHLGTGNEYIGYIPGNLTDEYDFMNYSIYELENQMDKEGCAFLDLSAGDLYFDQQRDVVWIPSDKTEAESDSLYLDSVVYSDVSRESNEDHMNYMSQVAQSHSAADFENMNVHLAVYSSGAAESDSAAPESEDNTPLTKDPVLGKYMTKDLLSVSEKIRAQSVSSAEGTADVSALGEKVSENYSYSGRADYSVTIDYSNGLSIVCTVTDPMKNIDVFLLVKIFHTIFVPLGTWIILVDILLGILCLMLFVFLMLAAGRRPLTESGADGGTEAAQKPVPEETEKPESGNQKRFRKKERKAALRAAQGYEIKESFIDRIPFDLFLLIFLSILGALLSVDIASAENIAPAPWRTLPPSQAYPILCAAVAAAAGGILLCILFFMSCAVRAKIGGLLEKHPDLAYSDPGGEDSRKSGEKNFRADVGRNARSFK